MGIGEEKRDRKYAVRCKQTPNHKNDDGDDDGRERGKNIYAKKNLREMNNTERKDVRVEQYSNILY